MAMARVPKQGKAPRSVRQARVMSHRARRQLAPSPDEAVARVEAEVGRAFEAWASRFIELVLRDIVPFQFKQDATVRQLFEEAGRAEPRKEVLESAFRMVDKQSADEMRVAGVRTADVVPGLPAKQAAWVRQNTDLIRAESDLRRRVERVIADPINEGRSVADISKKLQEQAGYSKSRAELTARDQTLKVYGQIQEERQRAAGITKYVWSTSLDERVRPDHAELDGTVQAWDDPPIVDKRTGRRANPGLDYQCRCTAVPVLDEDVETGGEPPPPEPVMQPTQAELDLVRRQAEAEARRAQLEAEADRRIAAARAEAERIAREQAAAERLERERQAAEAARQRAEQEARRQEQLERERRNAAALQAARVQPIADLVEVTAVASTVPTANRDAVFAAVQAASLPALKRLRVVERLEGGANGDYAPWDGELRVASTRPVSKAALPEVPGPGKLWSISSTAKTQPEAVRLTTLHEMGHHAHMWGVSRFQGSGASPASAAQRLAAVKVDVIVEALFADPKRAYITDYAGESAGTPAMYRSAEYFAEAHAAYHAHPAWLQRVAPKAYRAVEDVLRLRREADL